MKRKLGRTQVERRNETQNGILSAAIRILSEDGYAEFSASRVAARAGVSRGALEHYFPKRSDLIAAVTKHTMREAIEHARSLARASTGSSDPIGRFLKDSEHFFFKPIYRAMIEIMIAARSDRELTRVIHPIAKDARHVLNGIWADTLDAAGYPRENAQRFIELTHYLVRGLFLVTNWLPYRIDRAGVLQMWQQLAPKILELDRPQDRRQTAQYRQGRKDASLA